MSGFEHNPIPRNDLNDVALEAVQFSGSIQPHGVLLTFSDRDFVLLQVSANAQDYFGVPATDLLNKPLTLLFNEAAIAVIQQALERSSRLRGDHFCPSSVQIWRGSQGFNGTLSRHSNLIILELEPAQPVQPFQLHTQVKQAIAQLRQVPDLTEFLQSAAEEVRDLTRFDRVLVYQFDVQGAGMVVAEAKQENLPSYLGLHYPATDIPTPVRGLYGRGLMRYIPDLSARSVELIPTRNPLTNQPLDLTFSALRSVDPCCVEYHHNMGVAALLVLALIQGETLWGLISCHHHRPQPIAYEVREASDLLAQWIAAELANKVNLEEMKYVNQLRSLQSAFIASIAQADDLQQALVNPAPHLLDLVGAQGVAIVLDKETTLVGQTPSPEQVGRLMAWIDPQLPVQGGSTPTDSNPLESPKPAPTDVLFYTDALPKLYAEAAAFRDKVSGLLVLQISQVRHCTILWFRPEVLQTVNWAGDPGTSQTVAADGRVTLCPRQSFEQWQELVQFTSLPWKACELENALDLRNAIVGIVLKKADELARINQELENSIQELDSFAYAASHDLKEPLRGIHNFSNLLLKGYSEVLDDVGRSRLLTLIRLTRRMEALIDALLKFSRLGQAQLHLQPVDLHLLLHQVLEELPISRPDLQTQIRIPRPLPIVHCDPILIQEVLVNLISNAIKYNDKPEPWVEIGFIETSHPSTLPPSYSPPLPLSPSPPLPPSPPPTLSPFPPPYTFYVRDNGIGIRERHLSSVFRLFKRLHEQHLYGGGTGAGLTIAKKIIERHGGQIWVESNYGEGSTFYFTLE